MNEKSSQTSEMAVKLSEKRSELALERALMPTMRRRTRDYAAESPMYDGTVLCRLFEVKMYRKANIFCRMLALPNIERLIISHLRQPVCAHSVANMLKRERSSQHASHDLNSQYTYVT